jgi:hypothetical protein
MNRGRRGEKIFATKEDYWLFVDLLEELDEVFNSSSRSTRRRIFPTGLFGISDLNSIALGYLYAAILFSLSFSLEKFYANPVRGVDKRDANVRSKVHGVKRKCDAFFLETVTKPIKISLHTKAKVIGPPFHPLSGDYFLARSLAPDDDGDVPKGNDDLGGTANFLAVNNLAAQLLNIPGCSGFRFLTDDVDMVKKHVCIIHFDICSLLK